MNTYDESLVTNNLSIAYKIAWNYFQKFQSMVELEDLQSICLYGLTKAAQTYNKDLKYAFSTYAYSVIKNEVLHYYRSNIKHFNNISLDTEISENFTLMDTLSVEYDMDENLHNLENIKMLYKEIDKLKPKYKQIVEYRLKGYTFDKIGKLMNMHKSQVGEIYRKVINSFCYKFRVERRDI